MRILAARQVELVEHVAHVRLDRALAQEQSPGDAGVRQALGDEAEHLLLAFGQAADRIGLPASGHEAGDHEGVERGAAAGYSLGRADIEVR